jgi:ribokinase
LTTRGTRRSRGLVVLGAINWDTTVFEEDFAGPEEVAVLRVEEFPGGKGANAAVAAAKILGEGKVAFVGAVGDDPLGKQLLESLQGDGVLTDGVAVIRGASSGHAFIVVDGRGRKMIHTHLGANDALEPKHLGIPGIGSLMSNPSTVLIVDVPLGTALAGAEAARTNSRVIYSPGMRSSGPRNLVSKVIELADELIVDRSELAKLTGTQEVSAGLDALRHDFPDIIVVATLGPDGCVVSAEGSTSAVPPVDLETLGLRAVNSTGSGDAFLAAYACYSMLGLSPREAAEWGNLAGALKATRSETRGCPERRDLEAQMRILRRLRGRRQGSP